VSRGSGKSGAALILLLLAGIVIGGFLGYLSRDVSWLSWLNYGQEFGLGSPDGMGALQLNIGVIIITFGISIKITIASILGVVISLLIYSRL
jgi:hypothetical protein